MDDRKDELQAMLEGMTVESGDGENRTVGQAKAHQFVRAGGNYGGQIAYLSAVCSGNVAKMFRGGLSEGLDVTLGDARCSIPKADEKHFRYEFAQRGIGGGYVHVLIRIQGRHAILVLDDRADEWQTELMRVSTVPILPVWIDVLREGVRSRVRKTDLVTYGCDAEWYPSVTDEKLAEILVEAAEAGRIEVPECGTDMAELKDLKGYVGHYAGKMVEAAGGSLEPVYDPKREKLWLPRLTRWPFLPQAWLIEAVRRCIV